MNIGTKTYVMLEFQYSSMEIIIQNNVVPFLANLYPDPENHMFQQYMVSTRWNTAILSKCPAVPRPIISNLIDTEANNE